MSPRRRGTSVRSRRRRVMLLVLLLLVMLLMVNMQQNASALRPDLWVPVDISEWTVG